MPDRGPQIICSNNSKWQTYFGIRQNIYEWVYMSYIYGSFSALSIRQDRSAKKKIGIEELSYQDFTDHSAYSQSKTLILIV